MKKSKILMVCTLPPPVHGSAMVSQYIKDSKLINDEFDMDFVNLSTSRSMGEIGKASPLLLIKKLWRFFSAYIKCFWLLLINRYALCYCAITCHGIGFLKDAPFVLLCKLFKRGIVIHQHNKGMSKDVHKWPYRWLFPLVYRNTKVMLLSWYLYDDISRVVNREQVLICPNGIPEIPESVNVPYRNNPIPRLLFLSNLIKGKGVYVLLDACNILKEKGYRFECYFVGGETKQITEEIFEEEVTKRGLGNTISYRGRKYGEEKNAEFRNSDVFVFPTYYHNETFGLVNLEAMQYKLPIVTTNEGGIPDVVQDGVNGFVCERKDVNSLVDALEKLLKNKELREKMGNNGFEIYNNKFTLEHFEKRIVGILQSVICKE